MTAEDSAVRDIHVGEHDMLSIFKPDTLAGALVYLVSWAVVPDEGEKESILEHLVSKGKSR